MPSRWKSVDLLSVSSIAAPLQSAVKKSVAPTHRVTGRAPRNPDTSHHSDGAAAAAAAAAAGRRHPHTALHGVDRTLAVAPPSSASSSSSSSWASRAGADEGRGALAATHVSMTRLLSSPSLTWREALFCFVALAERSGGAEQKEQEDVVSEAGEAAACRDCVAVVPLEAIVRLYATLRRKDVVKGLEGDSEGDAYVEGEEVDGRGGRWETGCVPGGSAELQSRSGRSRSTARKQSEGVDAAWATADQNSLFSSSPSSSSTLPLSLQFLAYAARRHAALSPIARLLAAERGPAPLSASVFRTAASCDRYYSSGDARDALDSTAAPEQGQQHQKQQQREKRERERAATEWLCRLLSVSTVLHVGLGDVLRDHVPAEGAGVAAPTTAQLWAAIRTIHHLQRYGGASDYLEALAEAAAGDPAPSWFATQRNREAAATRPSAIRETRDGLPSPRQAQVRAAEQRGAAIHRWDDTRAAETHEALAAVERAAYLRPVFTPLLGALRAAWAEHNARCLYPAAKTGSDGSAATVAGVKEELSAPVWDDSAAVKGVVRAPPPPLDTHHNNNNNNNNSLGAEEADDAALAMVRALGVPPRPGSAGVSSALRDDDPVSAAVPLAELQEATLDVVSFVWSTMCIVERQRRESTSAASQQGAVTVGDVAPDSRAPPQDCPATSAGTLEGEALLDLVQTQTRFASFADLRRWLDRLLPLSATGGTVFQWRVLVSLLTRALHRAPSWATTTGVVAEYWPRMVQCFSALADVPAGSGPTRGMLSVPSLLHAFFASPHCPAIPDHRREELEAWCRVVCTPTRSVWGKGADGSTRVSASAGTLLLRGANDAPAAGESPTTSAGDAMVLPRHDEWSLLLYGACPPQREDATPGHVSQRHAVMTAAAVRVFRQWLKPAAALVRGRRHLARCHVQCAQEWAAVLPGACAASLAAAATAAPAAVDSLAEQHRAFVSVLMTSEEKAAWLEEVLSAAPRGAARQLIVRAAAAARTREVVRTPSRGALEEGPHVSSSHAPEMPMTLLEDLLRILERWAGTLEVSAAATAPQPSAEEAVVTVATPTVAASTAINTHEGTITSSNLGERGGEGRGGCLGAVGPLVGDIVAAIAAHETSIAMTHVTAASSSASVVSPAPSASQEWLLRGARRIVTTAGLRYEHELADGVGETTPRSAGNPPISSIGHGAAARAGRGQLSEKTSGPGKPSTTGGPDGERIARLRAWVDFLCDCPAALLADEQHTVVWLYIVMRQVEEMYPVAVDGGSAACPTVPTATAVVGDSGADEAQMWSAAAEHAAVRRTAAALSAQLWSTLPPASLLPPMLLNWLLTRGGMRTWGEAVRFLRAAATQQHAAAGAESQRRYTLLVLPLDKVTSVAHAMRVLRTLQLVEERWAALILAMAGTQGEPGRGCVETASATRGAPFLSAARAAPGFSASAAQRDASLRPGGLGAVNASAAARLAVLPALPEVTALLSRARPCSPCSAGDAGVDAAVATYYRHIEAVLLKEWYGRAVAAVLLFLCEHPEHTFLTATAAAPQHAAVAMRDRLAVGNTHNPHHRTASPTRQGGAEADAKALAMLLGDGTDSGGSAVLRRWRSWWWLGPGTVLDKGEEWAAQVSRSHGLAAERQSSASPSVLAALETPAARATADEGQLQHPGAAVQTPSSSSDQQQQPLEQDLTLLQPQDTSHAADATQPVPSCIPLHLLGSFVVQESQMGTAACAAAATGKKKRGAPQASAVVALADPYTAFAATSRGEAAAAAAWPKAQGMTMTAVPRRRSSLLTTSTLRALCLSADDPLRFPDLLDPAPGSERANSARARRAHPELVALFQRALQAKKAEANAGEGEAAASGETVEDVVCELLLRHCPTPPV